MRAPVASIFSAGFESDTWESGLDVRTYVGHLETPKQSDRLPMGHLTFRFVCPHGVLDSESKIGKDSGT